MDDSTQLNLLTRDGMVSVTFTPPLEQEHYAELRELCDECDTADELRKAITYAASNWQREVVFG